MLRTPSFSERTIAALVSALQDHNTHSQLGTLFLAMGLQEDGNTSFISKEKRVLNVVQDVLRSRTPSEADELLRGLIEHALDRWVDGVDPRLFESTTLKTLVERLRIDGWSMTARGLAHEN